jgi:uncharacterized protein
MKREVRNFIIQKAELRAAAEDKGKTLVGYAAVFNSRSEELGGFVEIIAPGAFTKTLSENRKIKALAHHEWDQVLGAVASGTLRLKTDEVGLHVEVDPPNTTYANDLVESVSRGDIDGMSFAFEPVIDEWEYNRETDEMIRTLKEVRLYEVSFVAYPAYSATSVGLRDLMSEERANELYQERDAAKRSQQTTTEAVIGAPPPEVGPILAKYRCL